MTTAQAPGGVTSSSSSLSSSLSSSFSGGTASRKRWGANGFSEGKEADDEIVAVKLSSSKKTDTDVSKPDVSVVDDVAGRSDAAAETTMAVEETAEGDAGREDGKDQVRSEDAMRRQDVSTLPNGAPQEEEEKEKEKEEFRPEPAEMSSSSSSSSSSPHNHAGISSSAKRRKTEEEREAQETAPKEFSLLNLSARVRKQRSCPYLGSINRHMLDFDFEKLCCICLSNQHVYCCLVCGKYFQGRGRATYCYTHALEENHYVYMNLQDCKVYCLPDNYLVEDASLDDIRYFLHPTYNEEAVKRINETVTYGKALDGTDFLPGCIGLNNLKKTDYFNVIIQALCNVIPLRSALLLMDLSRKQSPDPVLKTLGELIRKIFNPKNFKGIVSPHEFLQAVGVSSEKQFRIGEQKDPVALLSWLLARLHSKLKRKVTGESVVHQCFRGEVLVKTSPATTDGGSSSDDGVQTALTPFMFLTISLPDAPIFKDSLDRNMIPQVPIFDLLQKFDGETMHEAVPGQMRRYSMWRLPMYLIFNVQRFSKNNFFVEKNPTIVTFPVKNLDLKEYVHPDALQLNPVCRYNLVANICHEGKPQDGIYKVHLLHSPTNDWYEIEDLRVSQVLPQFVALSESYLQVYQRQDVKSDGSLDAEMRRAGTEEAAAAGPAARAAEEEERHEGEGANLMMDLDDGEDMFGDVGAD